MPRDFEQLHQQKGVLAEILGRYDEYISNAEEDYLKQISGIEKEISEAEKREPWELAELRKIYAMAVLEQMPQGYSSVEFNGVVIPVSELAEHESFENIISRTDHFCRSFNNRIRFTLTDFDAKVNPDMTYAERVANIERKTEKFKKEATGKIRTLRAEISNLHKEKFHEILHKNTSQIDDCLEKLDDRRDLLKYLILEGYLDDSYYQYISLFHKGRLSPSDNKFLIQIRSFNTPEPSHQINNASEVIAEMRPEDFEQSYVLNVDLIDHLFENSNENEDLIDKAIRFITRNFGSCDTFFINYYSNGKHISDLLNKLASSWSGFISASIQKGNAAEHIANIIAHIPSKTLADSYNEDRALSDYLSLNLAQVLEQQSDIDVTILQDLDIKLDEIKSIESFDKVAQFVIKNQQFAITPRNLRFVLEGILDQAQHTDIGLKQYSVILNSGNDGLANYVENNFNDYLQNVLQVSEANTQEDETAIRRALALDGISKELLEKFLIKQEIVFETLEEIPDAFHTTLLENQMVQATWSNVLMFIKSDEHDASILTAFMKHAENKTALFADSYERNDDTLPMSQFILNNDNFSDDEYREYIQVLPTHFKNFPEEISDTKKVILIQEQGVRLNESSFEAASENDEMLVLLLAKNMETYLSDKEKYQISDTIRIGLLNADIPLNEKLGVVLDVDADTVTSDKNSAAIMGPIIDQSETKFENLGYEYIKSIVKNSRPIKVQISLLNKYHGDLSVGEIKRIITDLPSPFDDIAELWKMPLIPNTPENRFFAEWLEQERIISSSKLSWTERDIRIYTFRNNEDGSDEDQLV